MIREFKRSRADGGTAGFTLIELLAAMAVLVVIVLMMGRLFADSVRTWAVGNKQVENSSNGRAVVNYIARELAMAVADEKLTFRLQSDFGAVITGANTEKPYGLYDSDAIRFVTLSGIPDNSDKHRAAVQVQYYMALMKDANNNNIPYRYRLLRSFRNDFKGPSYQAYKWPPVDWTFATGPNDHTPDQGGDVLAENVVSFEMWVWSDAAAANSSFNYSSAQPGNNNRLPLWADVYLELLGESDAIKAAELSAAGYSNMRDFLTQRSKGYMARVYFVNRRGYNEKRI
jgi:prepilin-type N-terminal cleavage/methylation domain-containing protein